MMMLKASQSALAVSFMALGFVSVARPVAAEDSDDAAVTAAARTLAIEGVKLAQADHCPDAIDKLEHAEKLHHSPIVLAQLGTCYIKGGRLVEGVERLRAVLREPLPANPSEALQQAYTDAKARVDETRPKLASLTITTDAPEDAELTLTIDGHSAPSALIGVAHPSDPGAHVLKLAATGYQASTRTVSLAPGDVQSIAIPLIRSPVAPHSPASVLGASSAVGASDDTSRPTVNASLGADSGASSRPWPAYVAWGGGAVALGVGIGFGVAAISNKSRLSELCPAKACPPEQRDLLDTGRRNATISTVAYAVAIGAAALGTVLYLLRARPDRASRNQAPRALQLEASPTGIVLRL
jgi:hypothetical protein